MKKYEAPAMDCRTFEAEDVITTSGTQSSVEEVKSQMADDGVSGNNIKVISWDDMTALF